MDFVGHGVVASNETEVAFGEFDRTFDVDDGFLFHFVEVVALNAVTKTNEKRNEIHVIEITPCIAQQMNESLPAPKDTTSAHHMSCHTEIRRERRKIRRIQYMLSPFIVSKCQIEPRQANEATG